MTEKRFKQVVDGVKDTRTGRTLTHPLEFTLKLNEINELYDCVFDRNEELEKENGQLKQSVNNLKDTIIKITIAYQRKYDRTIVDLVDEVHDEDITDLIKELQE